MELQENEPEVFGNTAALPIDLPPFSFSPGRSFGKNNRNEYTISSGRDTRVCTPCTSQHHKMTKRMKGTKSTKTLHQIHGALKL